ncbi:hypothetical protein PMG11_10282 [Penicillium brasilianum]|uniref:Fungal N-terminal domain-containing protein n=1 Tax=Penicillium brasilianum TaxID=104259 RepID=A0A0F7U338_PENBI|nr:hypothetical protein PMG11_10282 [Penicillium brasilianum]
MPVVSIGDIVACTQIAFHLYTTLTRGRKNAPRDMKELEAVLFGLYCALSHLERELEIILIGPSTRDERNIVQTQQQLERMIESCRTILEELDEATASYRYAAHDPPHSVSRPSYTVFGIGFSQHLRDQAKVQWRRVQWYLRSDSFAKYRMELQAHTSAINLLLNTMTWSNSTRSGKIGRQQSQRLEQIEHTTTQLNENMCRLLQVVTGPQTGNPHLVLPSLILPVMEPRAAYFPTENLSQFMDASPFALDPSSTNEQYRQDLAAPIWSFVPRIQHQPRLQVSDMASRVTEESECL